MKDLKSIVVTLAMMLSFGLASPVVWAQDGPPPDGPRQRDGGREAGQRDRGPGGRGGWENMTDEQREQMRERFEERRKQMEKQMNEQTREELDMSAEEFEALLPMIQKVRQLTQEQMAVGMSSMFGGRGNRGPGGGRGGFNPFGDTDSMSSQGKALSDATTALRETLDKDDVSADEVKSKLAALRSARNNMQDALRQAREELRGYMTPKQEATLVLQGLLD